MKRLLSVLTLMLLLFFFSVDSIAATTDKVPSDPPDTAGGQGLTEPLIITEYDYPFDTVEDAIKHGYQVDQSMPEPSKVPPEFLERAQILAQATGTITTSSTVRGGPSSSYASLGTVASGTSVTVIEQDGSYYFIQYSTSSGPTRGYVPQTAVSVSGTIPSATYSINKLGLNVYGSTLTVRGGPGTSYASIGSIYNREIVTVLRTEASSWYFIEYKTSSGNKRGYVATSNIRVPSFTYDYERPIRTGTRSQDYGGNHTGIDIAVATGASLYAIDGGTVEYRYRWENIDGTNYTVSYGNYAKLIFGNKTAIYAHMSEFVSGYPHCTYPKYQKSWGEQTVEVFVGSRSVSKGTYLGKSGDSGNSSGPHLHFEIREDNTIKDPFIYVLFPAMGC